jgi:hypothetical protein
MASTLSSQEDCSSINPTPLFSYHNNLNTPSTSRYLMKKRSTPSDKQNPHLHHGQRPLCREQEDLGNPYETCSLPDSHPIFDFVDPRSKAEEWRSVARGGVTILFLFHVNITSSSARDLNTPLEKWK